MRSKLWVRCVLVLSGVLLAGTAQADFPSVPKETYEALNLDRSASPKELHEALTKRYMDPGSVSTRPRAIPSDWPPGPASAPRKFPWGR